MLARLSRSLRNRFESLPARNREALAEAARDRDGGHPVAADPREHLVAAVDWLVRAQDATPDAGVARGYTMAWNSYFGLRGWQAPYPETTGYLIPTFCDAATYLGRPELRERALRAADWEIRVQLDSGAVRGGIMDGSPPTPAVFNTGQVIFGWVRAYRESGEGRFLDAARRAGDFLLGCQDASGAFCRGNSRYARSDATTYNTRVAWSLCLLGDTLGEKRYALAGRRNLDFGLSMQADSGWFRANCLSDPERPLLHTIAYAARGLLEGGLLLGEERYVAAARRAALGLAAAQRPDGGLAGRFASDWSPAAPWSCVTGDAQTAILWSKLAALTNDPALAEAARACCRFLMRTQNRTASDPGLAGGFKGSFPFDGEYGRYELLNWAAKFSVDALLLAFGAKAERNEGERA